MPKVSVIIPAYNRSDHLVESLDSVAAQTFKDVELILVDDGSVDRTLSVARGFLDRIQLKYLYQPHKGASAARNLGIRHARGEFLAFLDSDDLFTANKLLIQVNHFERHPNSMIVHSNFEKFCDGNTSPGIRKTDFYKGSIYPGILEHWQMLMAISCVMVRREIFNVVGLFDENLSFAEDLDMWARISRKFEFDHIPESLAKVRSHSGNISRDRSSLAARHLPYVLKSIRADKTLGKSHRSRIISTFYCYMALNTLVESRRSETAPARKHFIRSLKYWPFQIRSWLGFCISFFNETLRGRMGGLWRRWRDANWRYEPRP